MSYLRVAYKNITRVHDSKHKKPLKTHINIPQIPIFNKTSELCRKVWLPPATKILYPSPDEGLVKTFWSIRNLSKNTQITYSKYLRRLNKILDLKDPDSVEKYILGLHALL